MTQIEFNEFLQNCFDEIGNAEGINITQFSLQKCNNNDYFSGDLTYRLGPNYDVTLQLWTSKTLNPVTIEVPSTVVWGEGREQFVESLHQFKDKLKHQVSKLIEGK